MTTLRRNRAASQLACHPENPHAWGEGDPLLASHPSAQNGWKSIEPNPPSCHPENPHGLAHGFPKSNTLTITVLPAEGK
jgi:hypothetical protein